MISMTDGVGAAEEDRIRAALPGLKRRRIMGGLGMAATGAAGFIGAVWSLSLPDEGWKISALFVVGAGFLCFWIAKQTSRAHEAALMPIIAGTFGLSHQKNGKAFLRAAPSPFLPMGGVQAADDVLTGRLAGQVFTWAEVETETGGKNSRTLFHGLLLEVPAPGTPKLLAAPEEHTRPGMVFRADVDVQGLRWLGRDPGGGPGGTEVFSTDGDPSLTGPQVADLMARLLRLGGPVGGSFFAACFTGRALWLAISHDRELFAIGGVVSDEHTLMADIRRAAQDFRGPMEIAGRAMEVAAWLKDAVAKG
jgi:hypothetical protein